QSTITGGSSSKYASTPRSCSWFAHHIRWVLITALGAPVEPDVNRNLTMVSGVTRANAASTAASAAVAASSANAVVRRPVSGLRATATSTSGATTAAIAGAKAAPSAPNTTPAPSTPTLSPTT